MTRSHTVKCALPSVQDAEHDEHPLGVLPSIRGLRFVCPLCRGKLFVSETSYSCEACRKTFGVHAGIPDFRVFPDPYLDFREDRERTEIVLSGLEKYDLKKLLDYYWRFSDITPEDLRSKFIQSALRGEERARAAVEAFGRGGSTGYMSGNRILEIGSGTGNYLTAVIGKCECVVGTDIAMRWLHVSRRRFMDKGVPVPPLVCCCAEYLPFADGSFDRIAATSTLEFVKDQRKVMSEAARVLQAGGKFYLNSVNRYSLAQDPYCLLWGVGFVPRRWQAKYVFWRRLSIYNTRLLSFIEFQRLASSFFGTPEFMLPDISPNLMNQFSLFRRLEIRVYQFLKSFHIFSRILRHVGPGWEVVLKKPDSLGTRS